MGQCRKLTRGRLVFSEPIREASCPGVGTVITNRNNGFDLTQEEAFAVYANLRAGAAQGPLVRPWGGFDSLRE